MLSENFASSAIASGRYHLASCRMSLMFTSGRGYDFCHVPLRIWEGLCAAPSKGRYYNQFIRDKYDCR